MTQTSSSTSRTVPKVAIVGRVPPPPGGVGSSILSHLAALTASRRAAPQYVQWFEVPRLLLVRPDYIHFNFSQPWKRLLGALIGKLSGSRVIHTIHGNGFDFGDICNRSAIALSDGFIVLNESMKSRFQVHSPLSNVVLLTPILAQSANIVRPSLEPDIQAMISEIETPFVAAAYAHTREMRNGSETYGFFFLADLLPPLREMGVTVIFLDTKAEYSPAELDPHGTKNLVHVTRGVNFPALCQAVNLYFRPTTTDGNSVAVLEALEVGAPVVASDAVERPFGVATYTSGDRASFLAVTAKALKAKPDRSTNRQVSLSTVADYLAFIEGLARPARATSQPARRD